MRIPILTRAHAPVPPPLPLFVPSDQTHTEFVVREALRDLGNGMDNEAWVNLSHAWFVAVTKHETVTGVLAKELFAELTNGVWRGLL